MYFNKKGVGHIEIIMSFVLFLGFIGLALYFFSPFQNSRTIHSSLDYAFDEIIEETETTLESYSVVLGSGYSGDYVNISGNHLNKLIVVGVDGIPLDNYSVSEDKICFISGERFISILFNEEFSDSEGSCSFNTIVSDFQISSSKNESLIGETKMKNLVIEYFNNYDELKEKFNLPGRIDFGFSLTFDDGTQIIGEKEIPTNLEVVSKEDRVEVATREGVVFADLVVKVW